MYGILVFWSGVMLSVALAKESAFSFPWIPIWLGIQQNITFLPCLMVLSLFKSLTIKGLFWFAFFIDCRTEMESEWMINSFMLLGSIIWSTKFIAQISAVNMEASFGKHFFIAFLLKTAPHPALLLSLEPSV